MPIRFWVLSSRMQVGEHLSEKASEQVQLEQLLELGEDHIVSMANLEQKKRRCKAFVIGIEKGTKSPSRSAKPYWYSRHAWGKCPKNYGSDGQGHIGPQTLKMVLSNWEH